MKVLREPSLEVAVESFNRAISGRETIVAIVNCKVYYEGRGSSILEFGDRLVILKQDGAVLVHRPTGYSPVNWQPETSYVRAVLERDKLKIVAVRRKPREVLELEVSKVHLLAHTTLTDNAAFYEVGDESMIRDAIARNPRVLGEEFETIDVEKRVEPGFIDLYLRDELGRIVVVEIKRVKASVNAVKQLKKYIEALSRYVEKSKIRPILLAPDFTSSAIVAAEKFGVEIKRLDLKRLIEDIKREKSVKRDLLEYF